MVSESFGIEMVYYVRTTVMIEALMKVLASGHQKKIEAQCVKFKLTAVSGTAAAKALFDLPK
jgi:hypothetical protein